MEEAIIPDLDRIDLAILRALQADGRITNADLAQKVNLSAATCHRRTQRLQEAGVIGGVRALVTPEHVGLGALVMVGVVLDRSTPDSFAAFEAAVGAMKEVLDCNLVAGDFDYLLKIRTPDIRRYRAVLGEKISNLPHVANTSTNVAMETVKETW